MSTMGEAVSNDVIVESQVLGTLDVLDTQVYQFPDDLYGFPGASLFALLPGERAGFFWLQSLEFKALTFLLIDPFLFVEGYSVDVGAEELGTLACEDPSQVLVLSILTLPREQGHDATVNLQGPIVFNLAERLGKQVVLESPFGIRHPIKVSASAAAEKP